MARWGAVLIAISLGIPLLTGIHGFAGSGPHPMALTSADIPSWLVGDSWTFETHVVTRDGPNWTDAWTNLTLTISSRFESTQDGSYLYLYNASTVGNLSASGEMSISGFGSIPFTFTSNSIRGYAWTDRGDLAAVKTNESFVGNGTATIPLFGTRPLTASGNLTTINRPPEEDFDFPIALGDAWRVTSTLNTSGNARFVIDMQTPLQDIVIDQPLTGDAPLDADYTVTASEATTVPAGTFDTLRIHSATASVTSDRWYAPNASNYVRLETHDVSAPATYTHTWANLTTYTLAPPVVPVSVVLVPNKVGPGGPFTLYANSTAANAPLIVVIPAINFTTPGTTNGVGEFRAVVNAPAGNDDTPANEDVGSHGVLVEIAGGSFDAYGGATISLLPPDLHIDSLTASPIPVGDGIPTLLSSSVSVTTDVPVYAPVDVTFVAEDVDQDRDGRIDGPLNVYCARSACANTTVPSVFPGVPVNATATWTPAPPSVPSDVPVSAIVDPTNRYSEVAEYNNIVVALVRVEAPNLTLSNVTVAIGTATYSFVPATTGFVSPLIAIPTGSLVDLTAIAKNAGVINVAGSITVALYNTTTLNGTGDPPFAQFSTGPIEAGMEVGLATVSWAAPPATGTYFVNITTDFDNAVRETSEADNTFVVRIQAYDTASAPDLVPTSVVIPPKASVNRTITVTTRVANQGIGNASGFRVAFYNASSRGAPFAVLTLGPLGAGATSSVLSVNWYSGPPGPHDIRVEVDYDNAVPEADETNNLVGGTVTVYDVPMTSLEISTPNVGGNTTYILPVTRLHFVSPDRTGTGVPTIWYRVDSGPWTRIPEFQEFTLPAGPHRITWNATDPLGGVEPSRTADVFVDDLPPETTATLTNGTVGKVVTLAATDLGVGLDWTEYRVDGAPSWTLYNGTGIWITAPGNHTLEFRSTDLLGNTEEIHMMFVLVEAPPSNPVAGLNVKPILAAVFATMLFLAGWFASPSPDPPRRRRWLLTVVLPPAAIELATGGISLGVPEMAVPGGVLGVPVDAALLVIGLLVIWFSRERALRNP